MYGCFLAEGEKTVTEILNSDNHLLNIKTLLCTKEYAQSYPAITHKYNHLEISKKELKRISSLKTANMAVLEIEMPEYSINTKDLYKSYSLFYEEIRDPGNLGTIIRTADWFGIKNVFCSGQSVDVFNPKTIQSSMGSFARTKVHYLEFEALLSLLKTEKIPLISTELKGENLYKATIPDHGIIFFGNESKGLSEKISEKCSQKINIPSGGKNTAESLNLAISTGIICAELARRSYSK